MNDENLEKESSNKPSSQLNQTIAKRRLLGLTDPYSSGEHSDIADLFWGFGTCTVEVLVFFINMPTALKMILGVILLGIAISSLVGGYLFPNPIIAQLIDEVPSDGTKNDDISGC